MDTVGHTYDDVKAKAETLPLERINFALCSPVMILCTGWTEILLFTRNTDSSPCSVRCPPHHRLLHLTRTYAKSQHSPKLAPVTPRSSQRSSYVQLGPEELVFSLCFCYSFLIKGPGNYPAASTCSVNAPPLLGIWHLPRMW